MAYRDFARPAIVERAHSTQSWLDWLDEQGETLVPVAPRHPLSCERCYGSSSYREAGNAWPVCWQCRTYGDAVDALVPITYSLDAGLESMLHRYKDRNVNWLRMPLASLLTLFVGKHADCIEGVSGGVDLATLIPSGNPSRPFDHLGNLLRDVVANDPVLDIFNWRLDAIARDRSTTRPGRGELKPEAYSTNPHVVGGASVLLLDDTWTSGSSAASAAAALKAAGARHVTVVTLGRQLNIGNNFGSTRAIYDEQRTARWILDDCVLCARAHGR
ncbi:hypothetical protein [Xylanimonas protaetiae]|uniref:Phosphoribosyltransferase n=1 Tax=Xylanimonas protaetiae TaxID=2509457 RepID=A0A4P6EZY1_9MICO|nr:hypothetical protein [Xylanimonas protaetiae]QAY68742.1 hypothetical protein ET471_00680 [Xylanimonas protaetiae]